MPRFFGTPDGVHVGQQFIDRKDLHEHGVHRPLQAGISGTGKEGADSIVVSGGYVDDEDHGDFIIYTGHGGNDPKTRRQVADQSPTASGNAGLITSRILGLPVRVIRGAHRGSSFAPPYGYQYAGLYLVSDAWAKVGRDGFRIFLFRLDRLPDQAEIWTRRPATSDPAFGTATISRRIRDTALSREVKQMYNFRCQVCGGTVPAFGERLYAEGAHIRALGRPHLGHDSLDNILSLCPNHHAQLDLGGMVILDDFSAATTSDLVPFADLTFASSHRVTLENARYHRHLWLAVA
ncbi:putative restriction endonuclease [Homoserinimonas aerilata]|uniref:Putative restriction endonuclease n=1 Tax=Homoserinimonas aerilata TaxID=1162970 RepID=A0A542YGD1_9MICO|nr:putative restriction endonuclease [Homoserinimonas aerilata]